jgi:hypothetical protein
MQLPGTSTDTNVVTYFLYSNKVSGHNMFHLSRLIVASSFAVHNGHGRTVALGHRSKLPNPTVFLWPDHQHPRTLKSPAAATPKP